MTLSMTDYRVANIEFTNNSDDIKPGQWVESEVRFSFQGNDATGWVQHSPWDNTHNSGLIESVELDG